MEQEMKFKVEELSKLNNERSSLKGVLEGQIKENESNRKQKDNALLEQDRESMKKFEEFNNLNKQICERQMLEALEDQKKFRQKDYYTSVSFFP